MTSYNPAQVFASIPIVEKGRTNVTQTREMDLEQKSRKEVQVSATGDLTLLPDRCKITITISSRKDQVQEAKNSVQRRQDYVLQTLHQNQIPETSIHVNKVLRRLDGLFSMTTEITSHFVDFNKCQSVSNLLVEKLDDSVQASLPEFYHSPQRLENLRRQASLMAVRNAKQKAGEMAQFLNTRVGQPVTIREDSSNEWEGTNEASGDPDLPLSVQERINKATMNVSVKVSATFELQPKKSKSAKQ